MTIKSITRTDESDFEGTPLVGEYLKKYPKEVGSIHEVITSKISASGQWLMLDTASFRVMYNMKGTQAKVLLELYAGLNGCLADKMVAVCEKTSKGYGAYIASDDTSKREYWWIENTLIINPEGTGNATIKKLDLTPKTFNATKLK